MQTNNRLSDTRNPKTGTSFTAEMMTAGSTIVGLTWKASNDADPKLSAALIDAATELGWDNPTATLKRAANIQRAAKVQPAKSATPKKPGRVVSANARNVDPRKGTIQTWDPTTQGKTFI